MVNYCIYFISGHDFIKYQVMDDYGLHLSPLQASRAQIKTTGSTCVVFICVTGNRLTAFIYSLYYI